MSQTSTVKFTPALVQELVTQDYEQAIPLNQFTDYKCKISINPEVPPLIKELLLTYPIIYAGGAAINATLDLSVAGISDDDLWVYGATTEERQQLFNSVATHLFNRDGVVAGDKNGTLLVFSVPGYDRNIQLMLTGATEPVGVAADFDIDACRAYVTAEEGELVTYARVEALHAWETNTISDVKVLDPLRLEKMKRRGFEIAVNYPAPDEEELQAYLNRFYHHRETDDRATITAEMKTALSVDNVYFSAEEFKQGFVYRELRKLNLFYDSGRVKIIDDYAVFCFTADVTIVDVNREDDHRVRLQLVEVPDKLRELQSSLTEKADVAPLLSDDDVIFTTCERDAIPAGRHRVQLTYYGVNKPADVNRFYPTTRVTLA